MHKPTLYMNTLITHEWKARLDLVYSQFYFMMGEKWLWEHYFEVQYATQNRKNKYLKVAQQDLGDIN